jgi:hypothetical protein
MIVAHLTFGKLRMVNGSYDTHLGISPVNIC